MAYDNLDFDFKVKEPNDINSGSFESITTGTFIPLTHRATMGDIDCSQELWDASTLNPRGARDSTPPKIPSRGYILDRFKDVQESTVSAEEWYIRKIIINRHFPRYRETLGRLPSNLRIPSGKTIQFPARAMNLKASTNDDNIRIVQNMEEQIATPDEWYDTYMRLCHGDLGTQE